MPPEGFTLRRSTLDDLESLRGLWRECRLPEHLLEKRFTEFQLVVDPHGWIVAAVGLRFSGAHGEVHSLALRRPDLEKELKEALLERVLAIAQQQNAYRLWARENAGFGSDQGFEKVASQDRRQVPAAFGAGGEPWRTLKLREEPLKLIAAEEQLEAFLELERLRTERLVRRGQVLKVLATGFAAALFGLALYALFILLSRRPGPAARP